MNFLLRATCTAVWLLCLVQTGSPQLVLAESQTPPLHYQIDAFVTCRLTELKLTPAETSSDAEFVRRIYLDLTGSIPTASQARAFLDNSTSEKRRLLIDELLASPDYAIHMSRVFDVMLAERRVPTISSYDVSASLWRGYLTAAFAENRPWDQMVRDILGSDGADGPHAPGVKFFLVRDVAPHQLTRDVGRLFLGVDLQCAQCHDDPRFDAYKQEDYFGVYAFLQRTTAFRDNDKNMSLVGETAVGKATFVSVFTAASGETDPRLPGGEMVRDPVLEPGKEYILKPGPKDRGIPTYSRRMKLAELLPRHETRGFTRNIANRLWALLMGRGIIHPLDLHHPDNAPSHPELLAALETWLVDHKYDIKGLLRQIALSQTYQRSSLLPDGVLETADNTFAVARLRQLSPEQLSWSVLQATGRVEKHLSESPALAKGITVSTGEAPPLWKLRITQLEPLERQTRTLTQVFAGMAGQTEGDFQPVVDQALHLLNSPTILPLLQDPPSTLMTRLAEISDSVPLAEELYLSVLSRRPEVGESGEIRLLLESTRTPDERRNALLGIVWGLLLSSEFRLNH